MRSNLAALRAYAVTRTLFSPTDLARAVDLLGFVQIDPIRAPARAQDLVLRHRVTGYRVGDLERRFPELPLAEDFVHVYGVMPTATLDLLYPRAFGQPFRVEREHPRLAQSILAHVERAGPTHPRDLVRTLGKARMVNGWGGSSAATTRMLEVLHYRGMLRVVRRDKGIKVYGPARSREVTASPATRARTLLRLLVRLYAPLSLPALRPLAAMLAAESVPEDVRWRALDRLTKSDWLARGRFDGVDYVWPADERPEVEAPARARLLAPFDPLVWDRRRFAHLWGWDYRFEAYTPPAKRRYGYYALPLLWRDRVIGWANVTHQGGPLATDIGYAGKKPRGRAFMCALDCELELLAGALAR